MKSYSIFDDIITVYGIANFNKEKKITRLPSNVIARVPDLEFLGRRVPGARVGFRTNSKSLNVKIELETLSVDIGISIYGCQSAFVYAGEHTSSKFLGIVSPPNYDTKIYDRTFDLSGEMQDILIFLPRNEIIKSVEISIDDDAIMKRATPYKYAKPILYYGSSITEGGCCTNPACYYEAIISRHLDVDYYCFGFSGNCKGDLPLAEFFNTLDFSIFVYDYDHNAPTVEHLIATHEPFYKAIREANPSTPIIMMTRPRPYLTKDEEQRREVVKTTYESAIKNGDQNVYFIDGTSFFDGNDGELCFVDGTHPNDLGFFKMATKIEPLIKSLLKE